MREEEFKRVVRVYKLGASFNNWVCKIGKIVLH